MAAEAKITKDKRIGEETEAACEKCGDGTVHIIRAAIQEYNCDQPHPDFLFEWINRYEIIQCGGCKQFSFRKTQSNSEDYDPVTGEHYETVELFPSRVHGRTPVNDHELLPTALQRIYLETLKALNGGQPILAGIGIRAIVETVCRQQNADGKVLEKQIDDLVTKQVLPKVGADILQKLRILGNKAAHEVEPHDVLQLGFALDVIDNLISAVYILPHHAKATFESSRKRWKTRSKRGSAKR